MWIIAIIGLLGAVLFASLLIAGRYLGVHINKETCKRGVIFCIIFTIVLSSYILLM